MSFQLVAYSLLVVALFHHGIAKEEMCAGCPIEFEPQEDEGANKLLNKAFTNLNSNSPDSLHLIQIVKATKQVVNGIKYTFVVKVANDKTNAEKECQVVFVSRPWVGTELETGDITQTCWDNVRTKRELLGGLKDVDPSEMGMIEELADFAVKTLDDIDADNSKQIVDGILEAKKQLVNGIMYHLKLRVKTTDCSEETAKEDCKSGGLRKICSIQIHRSWADNSPLNAKVVKSECEPERRLIGGLEPIQTNDGSLDRIAQLAMKRINQMTNSVYVTGLVGITNAQSQVVAGIKYYLTLEVGDTNCLKNTYKDGDVCKVVPSNSKSTTECNVVVWDKPWEKFTEILSSDCKSVPVHPPKSKRSEEPNLKAGAPSDLNPNSPLVREMSQFALNEMDKTTNSPNRLGAGKILSATTQVVAGTLVTVKMLVGESDCLKSEPVTNSPCLSSNPTQVCTVTIWDRPWLQKREVKSTTCVPLRQKREANSVPGGVNNVDTNDERITNLIGFMGRELTNRVNSERIQKVVKINSATHQVVAGTLTKMEVEIADTDCLKTENKDPSSCNPLQEGRQICNVTIWERKWLNSTSMTESNCHKKEATV